MCGIAGIWDRNGTQALEPRVRRMTDALVTRGPDRGGMWIDPDARIALGHRRLSIIDLSETGSQPMSSACGRYSITYNGELYNTRELREQLALRNVSFRGWSDTEVLVNAIAEWGLDAALGKINGIFAFAVWDRHTRTLSLARDRVGVKPLFWSYVNGKLLFASEVRALAALPEFDRSLDMEAIGSFLQYNYVRAPMTIYRSARALEPGCVMTIPVNGAPASHRYWDLAAIVAGTSGERGRDVDPKEEVDRLEALLLDAVGRQLVSDVPIGAFLSGGVDSSTVVALMQKIAARPVSSFSIGFEMPEFNEAEMARTVAAHLGTEHTELVVMEKDALDCVPDLPAIYDQPLADPSTIPTYLLCRLARKHVTVALSGDGGDELFYGYSRYGQAARVHSRLRPLPRIVRSLVGQSVEAIGGRHFRRRGFERQGKIARLGWHAARLIDYASDDVKDVYLHFLTHWSEPGMVAPDAVRDEARWQASKRATPHFHELLMFHDTLTYMTDCVLAKVDRASMASSLEVRVPLLDHRVMELAWSLPQTLKHREGVGKWCLRQVLYRHVPQALVDRPKAGFGAPIGSWLRGPIRNWAEYLLSESVLRKWGVIDPVVAREVWSAHLSGKVDVSGRLWPLLMLQGWLEETQAPPSELGMPVLDASKA